MIMFTIELYKVDKRTKEGEKRVGTTDMEFPSKEDAIKYATYEYGKNPLYRFEIHETFVERINAMTLKPFIERYDTPYYCSPSSETYWSR